MDGKQSDGSNMVLAVPIGKHVAAASRRFRLEPDGGPAIDPVGVMVFVNRSGSNYLGELLVSTGKFSGFEEVLNDDAIERVGPDVEIDTFGGYLRWQMSRVKAADVWGMKADGWQLLLLHSARIIPDMMRPVLIEISRRNVIDQAVSLYAARYSGTWRGETPEGIPYSAQAIIDALREISEMEARNRLALALLNGPAVRVEYETLVDDPAGVVAHVGHAFGYSDLRPDPQLLARAAPISQVNLALRERFLHDLARLRVDWRAVERPHPNRGPGA